MADVIDCHYNFIASKVTRGAGNARVFCFRRDQWKLFTETSKA